MSCVSCKKKASKECSDCKRPYCSQKCFVGDRNHHHHRCIHLHSGAVLKGFNRGAQDNKKRFHIVGETVEMQLAYASLAPGETIAKEVHVGVTQVIRVEYGSGTIEFNDSTNVVNEGDVMIIPGNVPHEVRADQGVPLKISTMYAPPTTH